LFHDIISFVWNGSAKIDFSDAFQNPDAKLLVAFALEKVGHHFPFQKQVQD